MSAENGVVWRLRTRCEYMSAEDGLIPALMYSLGVGSADIARDSAPMHREGALNRGASTRTSTSGGVWAPIDQDPNGYPRPGRVRLVDPSGLR